MHGQSLPKASSAPLLRKLCQTLVGAPGRSGKQQIQLHADDHARLAESGDIRLADVDGMFDAEAPVALPIDPHRFLVGIEHHVCRCGAEGCVMIWKPRLSSSITSSR